MAQLPQRTCILELSLSQGVSQTDHAYHGIDWKPAGAYKLSRCRTFGDMRTLEVLFPIIIASSAPNIEHAGRLEEESM
jgi:hypothetical protein